MPVALPSSLGTAIELDFAGIPTSSPLPTEGQNIGYVEVDVSGTVYKVALVVPEGGVQEDSFTATTNVADALVLQVKVDDSDGTGEGTLYGSMGGTVKSIYLYW